MRTNVHYSVRQNYTTHLFPDFPHTPSDWTQEIAEELAYAEGLTLTAAHWQVARALQQISARGGDPTIYTNELRDVLQANFHPTWAVICPGPPGLWA